jgi:hypothetical protein
MESGFDPAARLSPTEKCTKVVIVQYFDGTAHIAPQGHTFPDRRKIEAKSIDRPSRNTGALGAAVGATLWLIARPDREELRG